MYCGIDRDPDALSFSEKILESLNVPFRLAQATFDRLSEVVSQWQLPHLDGILFDLGVSSPQIDRPERGFSFSQEGPLDMRMNPAQETTAADLVNTLEEKELHHILSRYGEERRARSIAHAIVQARQDEPIRTTGQLSDICRKVLRSRRKKGAPKQIHPATRTFQALRIAVNLELEQLSLALEQAIECLSPGGRVAVLSYHSLEDRIVKRMFRDATGVCKCPPGLPRCVCGAEKILDVLTSRPVRPGEEEKAENPRARSARLRVARKVIPESETEES